MNAAKGLLALVLCVVVHAGCGGGNASDASAASEVNLEVIETELGVPLDSEERKAFDAAVLARAEQFTAECMAERGFEYRQSAPVEGVDTAVASHDGLGIVGPITGRGVHPAATTDPNDEILALLGPEEQAAWFTALNRGTAITEAGFGTEVGATASESDGSLGCDAIGLQSATEALGGNVEAIDQYDEHMAAAFSDQRVIDAQTGWTRCMAELGHQYETTTGMRSDVLAQLDSILTQAAVPSADFDVQAELDMLYDFELSLASDSAECRIPVDEALALVRAELQAEFVSSRTG